MEAQYTHQRRFDNQSRFVCRLPSKRIRCPLLLSQSSNPTDPQDYYYGHTNASEYIHTYSNQLQL